MLGVQHGFLGMEAERGLFRDIVRRYCCRCIKTGERHRNAIKIKMAQERVRSASKSFLTTSLVGQPSAIFLQQVLGSNNLPSARPEPIPEESRCTSQQPTLGENNSSLSSFSITESLHQIPPV
ncbi:hypothetical protein L596_030837 [Steinernema carpocapsae]|uniref:Uncharacterized protein n=1 Tax=Steinernema carpocapsae TaxID=34508 RepID=A0A4U5LNC7_STECR|nr:hypothetical protein L596_030837 [Steinernema carpocapsae]